MKEFKKWEQKDCSSGKCSATDCGEVACTDCEDLREDGWRAALEWALTQETDLQPTEIADAIRKELKE